MHPSVAAGEAPIAPSVIQRRKVIRDFVCSAFSQSPEVSRAELQRETGVDGRTIRDFLREIAVLDPPSCLWRLRHPADTAFQERCAHLLLVECSAPILLVRSPSSSSRIVMFAADFLIL